ncbi:MAG: diaminopimelate decarboxylase [Pseudomonadales bacterium]
MTCFEYQQDVLHVESVAVPDIVASVGSPVYIYSRRYLETQYQRLVAAFSGTDVRIYYAVKANSNLAILRCFAALGAGFDIVSAGELSRVLAAGGDPAKVVFSGVGKTTEEIDFALKLGIDCFNVESAAELDRLSARAELLNKVASVAVRVNPDVDARTHPYISTGLKENKFGVPIEQARDLYRTAADRQWLKTTGIACHIGSQMSEAEPILEALQNLMVLHEELSNDGFELDHLDLGGGFGVSYDDEPEFDIAAFGSALRAALADRPSSDRPLALAVEPGRFLVANAGILVTKVEYLKPAPTPQHRNFAVVDAAMNDLIRPALYQAWHRVENVHRGSGTASASWDIVGPVCESGDFLAKERPLSVAEGDLLAIHSAGAYGMVQSSNYNSRPRPAEVLVDVADFQVVRRRETSADQLRLEIL